MSLSLVCLHGFTQNGAVLASQLTELSQQLPKSVEIVCPDAPHACSTATVERLWVPFNLEQQTPPYLCWWDASDDGTVYRGWETTLEQLRVLCDRPEQVAVLGFSQGAMAATALAALHDAGQFPRLAGVVLVAGRAPRSSALLPLMAAKLRLPSLHVWGDRDPLALEGSAALVEAFAEETRQVCRWPGAHALPTQGPAAEAIVQFLAARCASG